MLYGHNTNIILNFYNDRVKEVVAAEDIARPFTFVPIKAGHQELVLGNAMVFGKITEGYDPIKINVDIEKNYLALASVSGQTNLLVEALETAPRYTYFEPLYCAWGTEVTGCYRILIPSLVIPGAIYYISADWGGIDATASYTAQIGDTNEDIKIALDADIVSIWGAAALKVPIATDSASACYIFPFAKMVWGPSRPNPLTGGCMSNIPKPEINLNNVFYMTDRILAYILEVLNGPKFSTLKYGATHEFGLTYKDKVGRRCSVIRGSGLNLYLPFYGEDANVLVNTMIEVAFKINHIPPSWAESYEIVYAGNISMDYFLQIRINDIHDIDHDRWTMNIQDTLDFTYQQRSRWKVPSYIWESGDRIRLIGVLDEVTGVLAEYPKLYDYEIENTAVDYNGQVIGGEWLVVQAIDHPAAFDGRHDIIAEVYRPRKGLATTIFYGTGMCFEIGTDIYGNKFHKGDLDQELDESGVVLSPAQVNNTANDCWKYSRISFVHEDTERLWPFWAESIAPSDWWEVQTKLTSQGWPFLYDISQRQHYLDERLRFGGFLLEGTQTNNIALFDYDDFVDLPKKFGNITGIREIGFTLKVLQQYKETSIYIQRIQTFSADGGLSEYTLISRLLGTVRPESTDYGCQHPESVLVNDRNLYYWDDSEGKFIRSAPNGQIAISDNKMKRWFRDLSLWIKENGGSEALSVNAGANVDHNEIWVTWNVRGLSQGAIFSEDYGMWVSRIDQKVEGYVHLGRWFAHMYQQKLYIMNLDEGQQWLSWAGVPTVGEVQFVANLNPAKNKVFNSLGVYADHQLICLPRYIQIPPQASYALMETYVAVWNKTEGVYYGRILKDQNSPGNFASENARTMNGREIRGRYCIIRLRTEEHNEKVRIFSIEVISIDSKGTV